MTHLKSIGIENFKVFENNTIFNFKPITILTGQNSSGKTSLTHAIRLIQANKENVFSSSEINLKFINDAAVLRSFKNVVSKTSDENEITISLPFEWNSFYEKFIITLKFKPDENSKLNEGSTFAVYLPVNLNNSKANINEENIESDINEFNLDNIEKNKIVLIVEDDDVNAKLINKILKNIFKLDFAKNSKQAVEKATENQYDAILMDINLGKSENGMFATGKIRLLENYKEIPIIAMTAYAMYGDKEEFIKGGCTDYISKPFENNELISVLEKAFV